MSDHQNDTRPEDQLSPVSRQVLAAMMALPDGTTAGRIAEIVFGSAALGNVARVSASLWRMTGPIGGPDIPALVLSLQHGQETPALRWRLTYEGQRAAVRVLLHMSGIQSLGQAPEVGQTKPTFDLVTLFEPTPEAVRSMQDLGIPALVDESEISPEADDLATRYPMTGPQAQLLWTMSGLDPAIAEFAAELVAEMGHPAGIRWALYVAERLRKKGAKFTQE